MSSPASDAPAPQAPRSSSLLRSSAVMASGTLVSRILGFIRASMLLAALGSVAGGVMASFQTANTLPNMVFNILAAGVFDAVLVPQIVRAMKRTQGDVYVNRLITLAGTILFAVTLVAMVLSPLLILITAAGYDAEIRALAIAFSLVCLPQIFFYGLYNLLGEVLNARGVFGPYMWAPVVNNIVGIAGLAVFLVMWGVEPTILPIADFTGPQFWVLAGSSTLGVIAQALVLLIPLRSAGIKLRPDFHFRSTSFGSASKVAGWTFATLAVSQVGVLSTSNIAAQADAWAHRYQPNPSAVADAAQVVVGNAAYATAFMIFMVPQSLIAVSLATAVFTRLSHAAAQNDDRTVAENYSFGVKAISSLTLLAAAILMAGAIPMMQMVAPTTRPPVVEGYAWVLLALMPGVASTGMILMSQRVFFAYEDAKPVFLMGIVPTIVQVIVGWSVFFATGPRWWVVGAAAAETACRVVQGLIAIVWVARRNRYVNQRQLLLSYGYSFVASVAALLAGLGAMFVMGWHTDAQSVLGRVGASMGRLIVVSIVATIVFWLVMRFLAPAETARVGGLIAQRLPLPLGLTRFIVGRQEKDSVSSDDIDRPDTGDSGDLMNRDEHDEPQEHHGVPESFAPPAVPPRAFPAPAEAEADGQALPPLSFPEWMQLTPSEVADLSSASGSTDPFTDSSAASEDAADGMRVAGEDFSDDLLAFSAALEESLTDDDEPVTQPAGIPIYPDAVPALVGDTADEGDALAGSPVADGVGVEPATQGAAADAAAGPAAGTAAGSAGAAALAGGTAAAKEKAAAAAAAVSAGAATAYVATAVHARKALTAVQDAFSRAVDKAKASARAADAAPSAGIAADAVEADSLDDTLTVVPRFEEVAMSPAPAGSSTRPGGAPAQASPGRFDPTKPTVIFFVLFTIVAFVWAVQTATAPLEQPSFSRADEMASADQSAAQSDAQSGAQSGAAPAPVAAPAGPQISSVTVLSWRDDQGDYEDRAINMIDGNMETEWHSREFDRPFGDDTSLALVVRFKEKTTLSELTLHMPEGTEGGEISLKAPNAESPRRGEVLATTDMKPTTTISLPTPVETDSVTLTFRQVPRSVDGANWAWIYEITAK